MNGTGMDGWWFKIIVIIVLKLIEYYIIVILLYIFLKVELKFDWFVPRQL